MSYFLAFVLVFFGVIAVFTLRAFARWRVNAAREYQTATEKFFAATKPLLADDETPLEIIDVICALNDTIQDMRMASGLASYPAHVYWSEGTQRVFKVAEEFFAARPELEDGFHAMFTNWFIAVTALAPITGTVARYSLASLDSMKSAAARESRRA